MNYKIIADSSADLLELSDVAFESVPLRIITSEKEYVDDTHLRVTEMIDDLSIYKGKSKSSCPNVAEWKTAFEDYDNLFCVAITSGLSGSYNAAKLAMQEHLDQFPQKRGHVIDTLSAGPEIALIVEKLETLIASDMPFDEIVREITEYQTRTHLAFCLGSLRNLANNGRVNGAVAKIAGLIGIRIVGKASDKGELEITNKSRGLEKALADIIKNMQNCGYNGGRVRIHHCQNPAAAEELAKRIRKTFSKKAEIVIGETRALCSFYAEAGGLLVGYEGAEK